MVKLSIRKLFLLPLAHALVVSGLSPQNITFIQDVALNAITPNGELSDSPSTIAITADLWQESMERGTKLLNGMKYSDNDAASLYNFPTDTAESPFDGALVDELRKWGYSDNTPAMQKIHDKECNMASASGHMLSKTFADLGMGTASKGTGGPNECFQIQHYDGPAIIKSDEGILPEIREQHYSVCGTSYRATGAEYTIGVNAASGVLFALNRRSSPKAARELWRRKPEPPELPHLRSASDISWAVWNRAVSSTPSAKVENVKYFMNMIIINKETNQHIRRALSSITPPLDEVLLWPGTDFDMETEEGKVLLGSPVGRWAGYFLMQHKRQLGGSKYIQKVRVFRSEKEGSWPYLLFYVAEPETEEVAVQDDGKIDNTSRAKL